MRTNVANLLTHNQQQITDVCLNLKSFFPDLFESWQQDCRQGDAAEFTSLLLETAKQSCIKMSWEQRLLERKDAGTAVTVHDFGNAWMPINLAPAVDSTEALELADLLALWSGHLGMTTAMLTPSTLICCQFERLNAADARRANPLHFEKPCMVPYFVGPCITVEWREYVPFALISHAGNACSGHYHMAFQIGAGSDFTWLLLDDKQIATPFTKEMHAADVHGHGELPETFVQGITLIWMCRKDCLKLWHPLRNQLAWHVAKWRLELWQTADTMAGPSHKALDNVLQLLN